jgi:uncharacterized protein
MGNGRALLLFSRSPEREAAAKGFPRCAGRTLFRALAGGWMESALRAGAAVLISSPDPPTPQFSARWLPQTGQSFGQRLSRAVEAAFARGYGPVIVVAGDTPALDGPGLAHTFRHLEEHGGAALGPSPDGGVYLIGLSCPEAAVLSRIAPRRRDVFTECRRSLSGLQLLLPACADLDGPGRARAILARHDEPWRNWRTLLAALSHPDHPAPRPAGDPTAGHGLALPARAPPADLAA